jgi:hypothetical protein
MRRLPSARTSSTSTASSSEITTRRPALSFAPGRASAIHSAGQSRATPCVCGAAVAVRCTGRTGVGGRRVQQHDLRLTAAGPLAEQAGGDDARLVQDQHVAGLEQVHDVAEDAVLERVGVPPHDQQPAGVPLGRRMPCNQRVRQFVVDRRKW